MALRQAEEVPCGDVAVLRKLPVLLQLLHYRQERKVLGEGPMSESEIRDKMRELGWKEDRFEEFCEIFGYTVTERTDI